jgi:uncharacterized protein YggU (UPF0235/DUF167 family)
MKLFRWRAGHSRSLVRFLSEVLGIAKTRVEIVSGQTSREKRIRIGGMSELEMRRLLNIETE